MTGCESFAGMGAPVAQFADMCQPEHFDGMPQWKLASPDCMPGPHGGCLLPSAHGWQQEHVDGMRPWKVQSSDCAPGQHGGRVSPLTRAWQQEHFDGMPPWKVASSDSKSVLEGTGNAIGAQCVIQL